MADLTAADVTITIRKKTTQARVRINYLTLAFGDGSKTYPAAGGIPLPSPLKMGLQAGVIYDLQLTQNPAIGMLYKYDRVNNALKIWQNAGSAGAFVELGNVAVAATTSDATVHGK